MEETVVDGEKDDKGNRLRSIGNILSVDILYDFSDYVPFNGDNNIVEGSIMRLPHPYLLLRTGLTCLEQRGSRDGHK